MQLPMWLGQAFGLESATCTQVVVANLLGLAAIRLHDDLLDDELQDVPAADARRLSSVLFAAAIDVYSRLLPPASGFWPILRIRMGQWFAVTEAGRPSSLPPDGAGIPGPVDLALRGAPLRASGYAVCLLAGRTDAAARLDRCLDHTLTAMVLYDHFCDWREDLHAGRWNAFTAISATQPQTPDLARANEKEVIVGMMVRRTAAVHFARIRDELDEAMAISARIPIAGLSDHLAGYAARLDEQGRTTQSHYASLEERASTLLFGTRSRTSSQSQASRRRHIDEHR